MQNVYIKLTIQNVANIEIDKVMKKNILSRQSAKTFQSGFSLPVLAAKGGSECVMIDSEASSIVLLFVILIV